MPLFNFVPGNQRGGIVQIAPGEGERRAGSLQLARLVVERIDGQLLLFRRQRTLEDAVGCHARRVKVAEVECMPLGSIACIAAIAAAVMAYLLCCILLRVFSEAELSQIPGGGKLKKIMYRS